MYKGKQEEPPPGLSQEIKILSKSVYTYSNVMLLKSPQKPLIEICIFDIQAYCE